MTVTINGTSGITGNGSGITNLPAANLTGNLPAIDGSSLTNLSAANLTGTLPAISGANLTGLPGGGQYDADLDGNGATTIAGIPAGVRRIQVVLQNHSWTTASTSTYIRFGGAAIKTSGYQSYAKTLLEFAHTNQSTTAAFNFKSLAANEVVSGVGTFALRTDGSHIWVGSWQFGCGNDAIMNGNLMSWGTGHIDLGERLQRVQILGAGSYTHDSGARLTVNWSF